MNTDAMVWVAGRWLASIFILLVVSSIALAPPVRATSPDNANANAPRCPLSATYDRNNPFARIIRSELPASLVAEDKAVIAIIPLGWDHPGHVLIIPKRSARNLNDLTDGDMLAIFHMAKRIAVAQQRALGSTGFSLQQNNARDQDVCHAHFHVIPNTAIVATPKASRSEMDAMAARLRAALPAQ